eukprot:5039304-Prymnesium_polylepis.1
MDTFHIIGGQERLRWPLHPKLEDQQHSLPEPCRTGIGTWVDGFKGCVNPTATVQVVVAYA